MTPALLPLLALLLASEASTTKVCFGGEGPSVAYGPGGLTSGDGGRTGLGDPDIAWSDVRAPGAPRVAFCIAWEVTGSAADVTGLLGRRRLQLRHCQESLGPVAPKGFGVLSIEAGERKVSVRVQPASAGNIEPVLSCLSTLLEAWIAPHGLSESTVVRFRFTSPEGRTVR